MQDFALSQSAAVHNLAQKDSIVSFASRIPRNDAVETLRVDLSSLRENLQNFRSVHLRIANSPTQRKSIILHKEIFTMESQRFFCIIAKKITKEINAKEANPPRIPYAFGK